MNRIKQLRLEKNINQDTLGKILGLEVAGISKLETGRVPLKDEYIIKLSDYFNCTTDYLLGKSEYKNEKDFIDKNKSKIQTFGNYPENINMLIANIVSEMLSSDHPLLILDKRIPEFNNKYPEIKNNILALYEYTKNFNNLR